MLETQNRDFTPYFNSNKHKRVKTNCKCSKCGSELELVQNQHRESFFSCSNWQNCNEVFSANCDISNKLEPVYGIELES